LPGSAVRLLEDVASSSSFAKQSLVDASSVDAKIKEKTNIPVAFPTKSEKGALLNLESEIHKYIVDQNEAVSSISEAIRRVRSGVSSTNRPTSFLFLGPTGVGKTQTAKVVSNIYFGGEKEIIRLDMSEYSSEQGVEKLLDSSSGSFLDQVFNHPYSLILLDEFEKANSKVHNLFLQVFDDGRLTDNSAKTVSFQNALIVATSNAGSEYIRENISSQNSLPLNFSKILLDYLLKQNIFRPELLNRFDGLVVFKPLSQSDVLEVTRLILFELKKSLENQEIFVSFDNSVIEKVSKEGFDPQFGARPLRRFVQDFIEDELSKAILKDEIKKGDKLILSIDSSGKLIIDKNS
jgi:ATP-dependent Clp protease ATP-binding subunit ClpA